MSATPSPAATRGTFDAAHTKGEFNQYWYSANTIRALVHEVAHHATACAFLSTPSLFFALDERRGDETAEEDARLQQLRSQSRVFEYDQQWASDPCYVHYDFHHPEQVPIQYMAAFDYVVADPPFITADVWARYAATTRLLLREGGKLLFTTVLENHTTLENLMDRPLFIAAFYPLVERLTYQYVCFLSYEPTVLSRVNSEVPEVEAKVAAAIRMANDLRSSEKEFALQMATRRREGEERLPTAAYERDMLLAQDPEAKRKAEEEEAQRRGRDWDSIPIEKMEWGYVPEGLTMYPEGNEPPSAVAAAGEEGGVTAAAASHGPVYEACVQLRGHLDEFKSGIDAMQRHMDAQMKLRRQRVKLTKELAAAKEDEKVAAAAVADLEGQIAETTAAVEANETERTARLDAMAALASTIVAEEQALAALQGEAGEGAAGACEEVPYASVMADCVAAYRTVEAKKAPLQELAADATGRYKFPIFARMKALLQLMKEQKQK